jgi:hypothetical protein
MPVAIYINGAKDPNEKYQSPTSVAGTRPRIGVISPTISLGSINPRILLQASVGAYFIQAISNEMIRLSAWLCRDTEHVWQAQLRDGSLIVHRTWKSGISVPKSTLDGCCRRTESERRGLAGRRRQTRPAQQFCFTSVESRGRDDQLVELHQTDSDSEDLIQKLLANHPSILAANASGGAGLLLIQREYGIPENSAGSDRCSMDHLFVDRNGVPVLVEVKRATDTRARREVVA